MSEKSNKIFYVYVYLDTRKSGKYVYGEYSFDYEPFYIGKGSGKRSESHINEAKKINKSNIQINKNNLPNINLHKIRTIIKIYKSTGRWPIVKIINQNITEKESSDTEMLYIKTIGRYNLKNGPLTNLTDGGEGNSGFIVSDKTKKKISNSLKGKKQSFESNKKNSESHKGKSKSLETKLKMSKSKIGENNPNFGKKHSKQILEKISNSLKGIKNPMFGKKQSKEMRAKVSKKIINSDGVIFNSIKEASVYYNFSRSYVSGMLTGNKSNKLNLSYYI